MTPAIAATTIKAGRIQRSGLSGYQSTDQLRGRVYADCGHRHAADDRRDDGARPVSRSLWLAKKATMANDANAISTMIANVPSWVSQVNRATGSWR